jgi:hypothetical protein
VDDPAVVCVLDPVGGRGDQSGGDGERDGVLSPAEPVAEVRPAAVGGGDVRDRPGLADLVDGHGVGVVEPGRRPRLPAEPVPQRGRGEHVGAGDLQGDAAAEPRVEREEHHTEPAPSQLAADPEPADPQGGLRDRPPARGPFLQPLHALPAALQPPEQLRRPVEGRRRPRRRLPLPGGQAV